MVNRVASLLVPGAERAGTGGGGGGDGIGVVDLPAAIEAAAITPTAAAAGDLLLGQRPGAGPGGGPLAVLDTVNSLTLESITVGLSDTTTAITTGTGKDYWRVPYAFQVTEVSASLGTASSSGLPQFAIKKNGTTILSTNITIDATEKTSRTAATPPVISVPTLAVDDEITFDIVAAGTGAVNAKITIVGYRL